MKIVKETLYEIKQDKGSGLSAIGVGSTVMCRAYVEVEKLWNQINRIFPIDSKFWNWNDIYKDLPSQLEKVLDYPQSKIVVVNVKTLPDYVIKYMDDVVFSVRENFKTTHFSTSDGAAYVDYMTNSRYGATWITYEGFGKKTESFYGLRVPH